MTDLEMTKLCAEAMGVDEVEVGSGRSYWPLTEDAQAMALVKKFMLNHLFRYRDNSGEFLEAVRYTDLNRAIVECVAKMQSAATESRNASKGEE
jgi:hypothetical protein